MSVAWHAVNARARGLGTHLLDAHHRDELARAPDLDRLAQGLRAVGIADASATSAAALDRAIGHRAAARLSVLARWTQHLGPLTPILDDEDRRSLRVLLRGVAHGASPSARLVGLIPTPTLPPRTLEALAAATSLHVLAACLNAHGHPFARALRTALDAAGPGLFDLEVALGRAFAERARRATRCASPQLRRHVATVIDLENAWGALLLDGGDAAPDPAALFIAGGSRLALPGFLAVAQRSGHAARRRLIADAFAGTAPGTVFADETVPLTRLEAGVLDAQIGEQQRAARLDPLGPAPVLAYVLRLRAEAITLRRCVWRTALGPAGARPGGPT